MVQALYIDSRGPYPALLGAGSCWDQARDARYYDGPEAVVAHPPCGPWGRLKHLYKGTEHDCAPRALSQVCAYGGVLEHPANSDLWACAGLPKPGEEKRFVRGSGFTIQVDQCDWGHVARKSTWLYIVGLSGREIDKLFCYAAGRRGTGTPTHWVSGFKSRSRCATATGSPVPDGIKICSAQQRRRTPPEFAKWLISIAERCS